MSKKQKPADLPKGCVVCWGGKLPFVQTEKGARRCDCPRGIALSQMDRAKEVGR